MGAYLIEHPPVRDQFYKTRNRPLTGCTVLHTAESVMDTVGPDTGAEAVAEFIRQRSDPGSYHDLVDSDSWLPIVPYVSGAYHDGTGSNNWALSISFACRTSDWRAMSAEKRRGFLRQGARAFAAQQAWRKANGYPLTELRYITKAQSDAGMSGFIEHGRRDPGRRSDPGVSPPDLFPYDEWLDECRSALAGTTAPASQSRPVLEDPTMIVQIEPGKKAFLPTHRVPGGAATWYFNIVSGSDVGQPIYGKRVFRGGHTVGLFAGMWTGPQEWEQFIGMAQNVEGKVDGDLAFIEVVNNGTDTIAVSLTPVA